MKEMRDVIDSMEVRDFSDFSKSLLIDFIDQYSEDNNLSFKLYYANDDYEIFENAEEAIEFIATNKIYRVTVWTI